jgi:hypothetical protein
VKSPSVELELETDWGALYVPLAEAESERDSLTATKSALAWPFKNRPRDAAVIRKENCPALTLRHEKVIDMISSLCRQYLAKRGWLNQVYSALREGGADDGALAGACVEFQQDDLLIFAG